MSKSRNSQPPLTELVDADIRRIDAVKGPASGNRFLIAKASEGDAGLVSAETVRELIAEPVGDQYIGAAGEIVKAEDTEAPVAPVKKAKEPRMATKTAPAEKTPAVVVGDVKKAKAVLKQAAKDRKTAALVKRAKKIEKKALLAQVNALGIAKGTLGSLSDAHAALLDALKNEASKQGDGDPSDTMTMLQGFADKLAGLMSTHAASGGDDEAEPTAKIEPDGDEAAPIEKKASLRKARKLAKTAKLAKAAVRDEIKTAKARKTLAKIGRRNNATDQAHVDAIDDHAAALGATAHQGKNDGKPVIAKAADDSFNHTIELIQKAVGPLMEQDREAIRGELTQVRETLAKVAKTPLPGGPRVMVDRDGSLIPAGVGERGLSVEAAYLTKAAEKYPIGSIEREALSKIAATETIKELQSGR